MKNIVSIITGIILLTGIVSCESSEDISNNMDHEVPSYKVLTDSLVVNAGQTVSIKVDVSDNGGLSKLVFSYNNWKLRESITLASPKTYSFETSLTIPADAEKEWEESIVQNNGATVKITQQYHKLVLEATDIHMNIRIIPIYIKVE